MSISQLLNTKVDEMRSVADIVLRGAAELGLSLFPGDNSGLGTSADCSQGVAPGIVPDVVPGIGSGIGSGIVPGIGSGIVPGIGSGIVPGIGSGIVPGIGSDVVPGIGSDIVPGIGQNSDPTFDPIEDGGPGDFPGVDSSAASAFGKYYAFLEKRGKVVNLTAITGVEDVSRLHFLDSIALLKAAQFAGARVIDVGSGAGFPGVPLKIAEPTIDLTLLDATGKRIEFLSELCAVLAIDASCVHARAEDAAHNSDMREKYDVALSRAVAQLNVLCELCLPFVRIGGLFLAMKGPDSSDELAQSQNAIRTLGGELQECFEYKIPGTEITHSAVVIRKTSPTPDKYPRRFARIQKGPL